jgi:predicted dehydrogenase
VVHLGFTDMTIAIAVLGGGLIGREHLTRIACEPRCRVAALVEPGPDGPALAGQHGAAHFHDLDGMLAGPLPDAAVVATPNALHVPQALALVEHGVPVLVEKPVADSLEAGEALLRALRRAGVPVLVGHHRRHGPALRAAQTCVAEGRLGRLVALSAATLLAKPAGYFDAAWRRTRPGGGPVEINAVHDIDSLRVLGGDIVGVQARRSSAVRGHEVEDTAAVLLEFAIGALGTLLLSDTVAAPHSWERTSGENPIFPRETGQDCIHLHGTHGTLAVPTMRLWHQGEPSWAAPFDTQKLPLAEHDPLARQLAHFCDVVEGHATPLVDVADALSTLAATLALHDAAESGLRVVPTVYN